jgi:hypothetical protein
MVYALHTGYFTGFQRFRTYINALRLAVNQNSNLLDVNSPRTFRSVVCMGYVMACTWLLASNKASAGH